jgi:DDHD domain
MMFSSSHTFSPTCRLTRSVTFSGSKDDDDPPALRAQFFYTGPLYIDDPCAAVPIPTGAESKASNHPPRPFSARDNNALEEAWLSLMCSRRDKSHHQKRGLKQSTKVSTDKHGSTTSKASTKHGKMHAKEETMDGDVSQMRSGCVACSSSTSTDARSTETAEYPSKSTISASGIDIPRGELSSQAEVNDRQKAEDNPQRKAEALGNPYNPQCYDPHHAPLDMPAPACCLEVNEVKAEQRGSFTRTQGECDCCMGQQEVPIKDPVTVTKNQERESSMESKSKARKSRKDLPRASKREGLEFAQGDDADNYSKDPKLQGGSSIKPQLSKASSKDHKSTEHKAFEKHKHSKSHQNYGKHTGLNLAIQDQDDLNAEPKTTAGSSDSGTTRISCKRPLSCGGAPRSRVSSPSPSRENNNETGSSDHLCGGSRSSQLDMPETFHVHRCCKSNKISHDSIRLAVGQSMLYQVELPALQMTPIYWSPVHDTAAVTRGTWFYKDTMYPVEPAVANQLEIGYRELRPWSQTWSDELNSAIEVGAAGEEKISHRIWPKDGNQKIDGETWPDHTVPVDPYCAARCFHGEFAAAGTVDDSRRDDKIAEIVEVTKRFPNSHVIYKDSRHAFILKPSLQPSEYYGRKPLAKIRKGINVGICVVRGFDCRAWEKLYPSKKPVFRRRAEEATAVAGDTDTGKKAMCAACYEEEERPQVTDLVLVIHGIGQKLSERVESYHFTHAINAFRRLVNLELCNSTVQSVCRKDLGGIVVLPVNWRSNVIFENDRAKSGDKPRGAALNDFTLEDITLNTIRTLRSFISDVILDIPLYMSHHKPKMIQALITEANRIYRLWCRNNPKFHKEGRVHIIAHSLGSAMVLDVLSKQPNCAVPPPCYRKMHTKHFDFDTTNLFLAGSPAGFFLLLEKKGLIPRRCRNKPGADQSDDNNKEITGEVGTFGCLSVDNVYNIMCCNDPIAYRLNPTVDATYAALLKEAHVPSTTKWFNFFVAAPDKTRHSPQLELEEHNFRGEEIAEKKFYLLNDNGQIDYCLSSGSGPLEIQYLNMLGAHSSYWVSCDFVRLVVNEICRKPGKYNTLSSMKAVKVSQK